MKVTVNRIPTVLSFMRVTKLTFCLHTKDDFESIISELNRKIDDHKQCKTLLKNKLLSLITNSEEYIDETLLDVLYYGWNMENMDDAKIFLANLKALMYSVDIGYCQSIIKTLNAYIPLLRVRIQGLPEELYQVIEMLIQEKVCKSQTSDQRIHYIDNINDVVCLDCSLSEGAQGKVYKGYYRPMNNKEVAVKIEKIAQDAKSITNQKREIDVMFQLQKVDHVCTLYAVYKDKTNYYLIEELLLGQSLICYLLERHVCLTEDEARVVMKQLLSTVKQLHDMQIIHRDIKLDNIMLSNTNTLDNITLIDFGFSREVADVAESHYGTCAYECPEIISNRPYDLTADNWSIGVVLYSMVTYNFPFGSKESDLNSAIINGHYDRHNVRYCNLSEECKDLINQFLQVEPSRRISLSNALHHPWMLATSTSTSLSMDDTTDESVQPIISMAPISLLQSIPMTKLYCILQTNVFKTLEDERPCMQLNEKSTVYCDATYYHNKTFWYHCISQPLYNDTLFRPENKWIQTAVQDKPYFTHTDHQFYYKCCQPHYNNFCYVFCEGIQCIVSIDKLARFGIIVNRTFTNNYGEYGILSPETCVVLGLQTPLKTYTILLRNEESVYFMKSVVWN